MMSCLISRKKLQYNLENVKSFSSPKIELEQYCTSAHVAADILFNMQMVDQSIEGMTVCDLGCGSGMLSIGACLLGASHVFAFDIDPDAVSDFKQNLEDCDLTDEGIEIVLCDVTKLWKDDLRKFVDTTILNPPFGTNAKNNGLDMEFLKVALSISKSHVYSLHKSTTREHVLKTIQKSGAKAEVVGEIRFDLPRTYKRHRQNSVDIAVDLVHSWFPGE